MESLKIKNEKFDYYVNPKSIFQFNELEPIKCRVRCINGGYDIYIYDLIDENYDLEKTINNLSWEINKTKNNIINIYYKNDENDEYSIVFKNKKSQEIIETLKLKFDLEKQIKKNIILKKMKDFNKILNYVEDQLFIEKIKSTIYKIENIRNKNSKAKEILILKNSMQIKNQKNLNN